MKKILEAVAMGLSFALWLPMIAACNSTQEADRTKASTSTTPSAIWLEIRDADVTIDWIKFG